MPLERPYFCTARPRVDGRFYADRDGYVSDPRYAHRPEQSVRAFILLQKDLQEVFDYIEPADSNAECYSYRLQELLARACIEVEANCKAILAANAYKKSGNLNILDFHQVEQSHRLSGYRVRLPTWTGEQAERAPFANWASDHRLSWYRAYNASKHDRHGSFSEANLRHAVDAVCACLVLLSAQFCTEDFVSWNDVLFTGSTRHGMEGGIGGYFGVAFPDWPLEERYDFRWQDLKDADEPFARYPYPDPPNPPRCMAASAIPAEGD
jgi:hypothetical protein